MFRPSRWISLVNLGSLRLSDLRGDDGEEGGGEVVVEGGEVDVLEGKFVVAAREGVCE